MSKPNRYYTFLLIEHVQFERDIDSPVLVKVSRHKEHSTIKKTVFKAQTTFLMADASHSIHYDSEFCIKIKINKKHGKIGKQIINVKLEQMNAIKKKREKIGEWIFDAANFENPTSVDIRSSKTQLTQNMGEATLFFRCVVLPYSDYPDGPPEHFYNFVARTYSPQFVDINDTLTTTTETSLGDENAPQTNSVNIIEKKINPEIFSHQPQEHLASFLKPVEMKTKKKQTDSESSTASEPVQAHSKPEESESSGKKKKTDEFKADDDDGKKKKKRSRKNSELKEGDADPNKKEKKRRRKSSKLTEKAVTNTETQDDSKNEKENEKNDKTPDESATPENPQKEEQSPRSEKEDQNLKSEKDEQSTKSEKEDQNIKSEKDEQSSKSEKDEQSSKSEKEEQNTKSEKDEQSSKSEKEEQNQNSEKEEKNENSEKDDQTQKIDKKETKSNTERVPKFSQESAPQKLQRSRKNSTNLSSLNSFFGEKKIRKKSSNVSLSDNPLANDDVSKPIHSYNNLHLNKYYEDFKPLYDKHQKAIMELAIDQCTPVFIKTVMNCLIAPPNVLQDFSDRLLEPINSYSILQFPALTSEDLLELISPVYRGIKIAISRPHQLDEWFSILATTLNFGLKLSSTASLYTSAHIESLTNLAKYITQIIQQLTQTLVGTIAPSISDDGFTFADEQSMSMIEQVTRLFLEYTQAFKIPDQIVQVIVNESCNYIDSLLFNAIIDTASVFTDEKVTGLLQKIRQLQQMFDCIPKNFQTAFNHLLGFISTTKALLIGVDDPDQRKVIMLQKGPLLRSIIDRCQPPIEIPEGISIDDFGEKIENTQQLKLPLETTGFDFTFEWLYTQNTSNNWDML